MVSLTETQSKALAFIWQEMERAGSPPTLRELAQHFGWKAVGTAQDVVAALRKKGFLVTPEAGKSRQLVPTPAARAAWQQEGAQIISLPGGESRFKAQRSPVPSPPSSLRVPLLGSVPAGVPVEVFHDASHPTVEFPVRSKNHLIDASHHFALVVDGFSMQGAGLLPGDLILVEQQAAPQNGQVVVAMVAGEMTVKRFAVRGSQAYRQAMLSGPALAPERLPPALLVPENPDFDAIPFGAEEDRVLGVVRQLYRSQVS